MLFLIILALKTTELKLNLIKSLIKHIGIKIKQIPPEYIYFYDAQYSHTGV